MEDRPHISPGVLARYAADAALEVEGVEALVKEKVRRHDGVRVSEEDGGSLAVEVHVRAATGTSLPRLGREVQERVAGYLEQMAGSAPSVVDVIVHEIG
jgi:uncharacterized alkaline shock family protein YloU